MSDVVVLSIPGRPLGVNQVEGMHPGRRARLRRLVKRDAALVWAEAGRPAWPRGARMFVRAVFGSPARRDAANYVGAGTAKWIVDALTECGAWPDDSQRWLELAGGEVVYRRGEWAIELEIAGR